LVGGLGGDDLQRFGQRPVGGQPGEALREEVVGERSGFGERLRQEVGLAVVEEVGGVGAVGEGGVPGVDLVGGE